MINENYYKPVSFTKVDIHDGFWEPKRLVNRLVTIPAEYSQCKETGRIDAFRLDWQPGNEPKPHFFWDSDVAKWIEAASYSLATHQDPELDSLLDEVISLIVSAQQPDGYLNVYFTSVEPQKRWTNLRDYHELFCAGHMMEAAVAHFQATGKKSLLDVLGRYADYIDSVFGSDPDKKHGYCGHEEIELALVKLYRATGNKKYLDLSSYFVNERGNAPSYFDLEAQMRGEDATAFQFGGYHYMQAHVPVRQQEKVTGHSVRAMYLYSAMADLAVELDDTSLLQACEKLWADLCSKQMYITGGIGAYADNEGFARDYDLPNETAYCETCASIGLVFWSHRMLQKECDRRYSDVMERALYNGVLSGVSLDGIKFFYGNPLAAYAGSNPHGHKNTSSDYYQRSEWFGCSCCPPNIARLLASLGEYVYSSSKTDIAVHLYVESDVQLQLGNINITLSQKTDYPWDGHIHLAIDAEAPAEFTLRLRIPSWSAHYKILLNGEEASGKGKIEQGYFAVQKMWLPGDSIELELDMPVMLAYSHPDIRQNTGCAAITRGPLIYCLEQPDHDISIHRIALSDSGKLVEEFQTGLLNGVMTIQGEAVYADIEGWNGELYRTEPPAYMSCRITAIPYFAWNNREPGEMRVWIPLRC